MKDLLKAIIKEEIARAMIEERNWKDVARNLAVVASLAGGAAYGGHKLGQAVHSDPAVTAKAQANQINTKAKLIDAVESLQFKVDEESQASMAIAGLINAPSEEKEARLQDAISALSSIPRDQRGEDIQTVLDSAMKLMQLPQS